MKQKLSALFVSLVSVLLFSFGLQQGNEYPGERVVNNFKTDFPLATGVEWKFSKTAYVASFTNNQKIQLAYYNENGDFLGQAWQVMIDELPQQVKNAILKDVDASAIKSLHIFLRPETSPKYYATLELNGRKITREILSSGESFVVRKIKLPVS